MIWTQRHTPDNVLVLKCVKMASSKNNYINSQEDVEDKELLHTVVGKIN